MLFKSSPFGSVQPVLRADNIILRLPERSDCESWIALRSESKEFLQFWEPVWSERELTKRSFYRRVKFYQSQAKKEAGYSLLIFDAETNVLVGGLNMTQFQKGVIQSCVLGYWIGEAFQRQGYMTRAVTLACDYAFHTHGLHRVEAACLMDNTASIRLLRKTGFYFEGLAREYLKINNQWQDHFLFAKLSPNKKRLEKTDF